MMTKSPHNGPNSHADAEAIRVTETGPDEAVDGRAHPLATLLVLLAMLGIMVVGVVALAQSIEGDGEQLEVTRVVLPRFADRQWSDAQQHLERLGLLVDVEFSPNERVPQNTVVDQDPIAGSRVEVGSVVTLVASDGPIGLQVPDIVGLQTYEATEVLDLNLLQHEFELIFDDNIRPGAVVSSDPPAGARIQSQGVVTLQISEGPEPRVIPDIVGQITPDAFALLGRADLEVGDISIEYVDNLDDAYRVVSTSPAASETVPPNFPIDVVISQPRVDTIPDLTGLRISFARRLASEFGFTISVQRQSLPSGDRRDGIVLRQEPLAGTFPGATTEIVVIEGVAAAAPPPPPTPSPTPPDTNDSTAGD